jgi:hypothetical protein
MTVGELQAALAKLDSEHNIMIALNGSFVPLIGVTAAAAGTNFVVIRGKGKIQQSKRFSIDEEGIIGHLARLGLSDDEIGEVLGRPSDSVKRKRKALGF